MNGVLQDRLVKALRLAGLSDMENQRIFGPRVSAGSIGSFRCRRPAPRMCIKTFHESWEILSWEVPRVVQRDWTVASGGKWYQVDRQHEALSLVGKKVIVRTLRDGQIQLESGRGEIALERTGQTPRAGLDGGGPSGEKSRALETGGRPSLAPTAVWSLDPRQNNDTCPWGTTVGLRYAPASLRPPRAGETNPNHNQWDIIS